MDIESKYSRIIINKIYVQNYNFNKHMYSVLTLVGGTTDGSRRITTGITIASIIYMPADMRVDI